MEWSLVSIVTIFKSIIGLLKIAKGKIPNDKLMETLAYTIASLSRTTENQKVERFFIYQIVWRLVITASLCR